MADRETFQPWWEVEECHRGLWSLLYDSLDYQEAHDFFADQREAGYTVRLVKVSRELVE